MVKTKEIADTNNWSNEDLGKQSGIKKSTINNYMNGTTSPKLEEYIRICHAFELSFEVLLSVEDLSLIPTAKRIISDKANSIGNCQDCPDKERTINVLTKQLEKTQIELDECHRGTENSKQISA